MADGLGNFCRTQRTALLMTAGHFTEQDIRGLINQISSKENEEGVVSRKVGKFGTGFLTTHLLSRVIDVEGIVETEDGKFFTMGRLRSHLVR